MVKKTTASTDEDCVTSVDHAQPAAPAPGALPPPPGNAPAVPLPPPSVGPAAVPVLPSLPARAVAPPTPRATAPSELPATTIQALTAQSPEHAWKTAPRKRRSFFFRYLRFRVLATLVVLAIGGASSGYDWVRENVLTTSDAPAPPAEWAAAVRPVVDFIEAERGLEFDHPVAVEFLSEADYVALFSTDDTELSADDRAAADSVSGIYSAAGLAGDVDLFAAQSRVASVATLGVYLPDEDRIFVRGAALTPAVRAVLAHELTHALQAQHFDLRLGGPDDLSVRAIVEADALRIEQRFVDSMSPGERSEAQLGLEGDADLERELSDVPSAIVEQTFAPYVLGPLLVDTVVSERGNAGVDDLLRSPPSEEILVDPFLFGTTQTDAAPLATPPAGTTVLEETQPLSIVDTLSLLDAWLPWSQARGALDGWAGGGYVSYERADGTVCLRMNAAFDQNPVPFATAVTDWAAAAGSDATPEIRGNRVEFDACERGAGASDPPPPVVPMTTALAFEYAFVRDVQTTAANDSMPAARCVARKLVDDPTTGPLLVQPDWTPADQETFAWVRGEFSGECGLVLRSEPAD